MDRKKRLKSCDKLSDDAKYTGARDLKEVVDKLSKKRAKTGTRRTATNKLLYESLAVALTLHYCTVDYPKRKRRFQKLVDKVGAWKIRKGSNDNLPLVRVCIPDRHRRDYHRYAATVSRAIKEKLSPSILYNKLQKNNGGMTVFMQRRGLPWD